MSMARWVRDRSLTVAIVAVAMALAVSGFFYIWLGPVVKQNEFVGPPRSGYVLHNFTMWSYDAQTGRLSFRMAAPHLERREGDDSIYINSPVYLMPSKKPGVPDWDGNSLYAWVDNTGSLFKLQGPVYMHRPAYSDPKQGPVPETTLHTSEVTAFPNENRMETAEAAKIVQGPRTMSGIGMRADLDDNHVETLNDSHGTLPPRKRKS